MNDIEWIATTQKSQWQSKDQLTVSAASNSKWDVEAYLDQPLQTIEGFGACFNELGWTSLNTLASARQRSNSSRSFRSRCRCQLQYVSHAGGR